MLNQLNEISATWIGVIALAIIALIIVVYTFASSRAKKKSFLMDLIIAVVALVCAVFLAKPLVSLFDKMFSFSTAMVEVFMKSFAGIPSMNNVVTATNYSTAVENFKSSEVGLSSTVKNYLVGVFENTKLEANEKTTLSLIASKSFSYLFALFFVALITFVVLLVTFKIVLKLILKRKNFFENDKPKKIITIPLGFLKGVVVCLIALVTFSSIPFFGVETDYLSTGFETTKVFHTPYEWIVKMEQDMYKNSIDWKGVYSSTANKYENIEYGLYNDTNQESPYNLKITLVGDILTQTLTVDDNLIVTNYGYVYTMNRLYLFNTDGSYVASYGYGVGTEKNNITVKLIVVDKVYSTTLSINK